MWLSGFTVSELTPIMAGARSQLMEFVYPEYCAHPKAYARRHASRVLRARRAPAAVRGRRRSPTHLAAGRSSDRALRVQGRSKRFTRSAMCWARSTRRSTTPRFGPLPQSRRCSAWRRPWHPIGGLSLTRRRANTSSAWLMRPAPGTAGSFHGESHALWKLQVRLHPDRRRDV